MNRPKEKVSEGKENTISPRVNIREEKDGVVLEAEIPGVRREDLRISVEGGELTIRGKRSREYGGTRAVLEERPLCTYARSFVLSDIIDSGRIEASLANGILTLTLPKSEKAKPRKIEIS